MCKGMQAFFHVNDAFLMGMVRKLEGNPSLRISCDSATFVMKFGSFYTQFDRFTYLRIGGFEEAPLKLPRFPSDYIVFLEVCRQMVVVNVKYLNMGKKGYTVSLSTPHFSCKTNGTAKAMEIILEKLHFQSLSSRNSFDNKGYVKHNLYGAKGYMHWPKLEDF